MITNKVVEELTNTELKFFTKPNIGLLPFKVMMNMINNCYNKISYNDSENVVCSNELVFSGHRE